MTEIRFKSLLTAYLNNQLSPEEFEEFFTHLSDYDDQQIQQFVAELLDKQSDAGATIPLALDYDLIHAKIVANIQQQESKKLHKVSWRSSLNWLPYVAAALLVFFFIHQFYTSKKQESVRDAIVQIEGNTDVMPGGNKASITVDGQVIHLKENLQGVDLTQPVPSYLNGGEVSNSDWSSSKQFKIEIPRAGQYQFILPDGSKVWLNSQSMLSYNGGYNQHNREIHLEGEAYFEIKSNKTLPVIIHTRGQSIKVLGTKFNVKSYRDEEVSKTTLLEGSIAYAIGEKMSLLKPSEQVKYDFKEKTLQKQKVAVAAELAWKEGIINLHNVTLKECMQMISRWYDVDILYEGEIPNITLGGKMSKGVKLSNFLKFLKQNYQIEGEIRSDKKLLIKKIT